MYITSYHFLPTVQETISNQNHISYQIRFKGRCFNMLEYIYIYTITDFSPMASCMWHFPKPLHLTTPMLQLLKDIDNVTVQNMIDG